MAKLSSYAGPNYGMGLTNKGQQAYPAAPRKKPRIRPQPKKPQPTLSTLSDSRGLANAMAPAPNPFQSTISRAAAPIIQDKASYGGMAGFGGAPQGMAGTVSNGGMAGFGGAPQGKNSTTNGLPALPGYPSFEYPAQEQYNQAYLSALAAARGGIENQFKIALTDLSQREGMANQQIAAMPGQFNTIYDQGQKNTEANTKAVVNAAVKSPGGMFQDQEAVMGPLARAAENDRAGALADVPLIQGAATSGFATMRAGLNSERMGSLSDMALQEAQYRQQADDRYFAMKHDDALAKWSAEREYAMQQQAQAREDAQRQEAYRREDSQRQQEHGWDMDEAAAAAGLKAPTFGTAEVTAERGGYLAHTDPGTADRMRSTGMYQQAKDMVTKMNPDQIAALLMGAPGDVAKVQASLGHNLNISPDFLSLVLFDLNLTK